MIELGRVQGLLSNNKAQKVFNQCQSNHKVEGPPLCLDAPYISRRKPLSKPASELLIITCVIHIRNIYKPWYALHIIFRGLLDTCHFMSHHDLYHLFTLLNDPTGSHVLVDRNACLFTALCSCQMLFFKFILFWHVYVVCRPKLCCARHGLKTSGLFWSSIRWTDLSWSWSWPPKKLMATCRRS